MTNLAAQTGRPSIIVFDRGMMDAKGYMDAEMWEKVLSHVDLRHPVTEDYVRGRYDGVIHLVTAANGASKWYKWGKTMDDSGHEVFRKESPDEAIALDNQMIRVWSGHERHIVIENTSEGFSSKLERAANAVLDIAKEAHPQEYQKASGGVGPRLKSLFGFAN